MPPRARLDAELVRRRLARSRADAAELIAAGRVLIGGLPAAKPATAVGRDTTITVEPVPGPRWVSRGALKLLGALEQLPGIEIGGRRCLDAGASTGGFTQVLLEHGAGRIIAADVGYGQLAWPLRQDPRVEVLERCNVRSLRPEDIGGAVDLTVADLSFISLRTVLPALVACTAASGDLLLMVKPQFEVGRQDAGQGVVRDPALRARSITDVAAAATSLGLGSVDVVPSPLPGPAGNVEYFLWLRKAGGEATADPDAVRRLAQRAVARGPDRPHGGTGSATPDGPSRD